MAKQEKKAPLGKVGRVEREKRRNNILTIGMITVVGAIITVLIAGAVLTNIVWPKQPVASVNDHQIITTDFQARVRYERQDLISLYIQYYNIASQAGDPNVSDQYQFILQNVAQQLDPVTVGEKTLNDMVDEIIIKSEAQKLGFTVSEEELDQAFEEFFGFYQGGTPTSGPTQLVNPTSTLSPRQLAVITAEPSPTLTEELEATATSEVTEEPTEEAEAEDTPTPFPTIAIPTPTVFTKDIYKTKVADTFDRLYDSVEVSREDVRSLLEYRLYTEIMLEEITKDLPADEEQVWVRQILVTDNETAQDIADRLDDGEDWDTLHAEFSIDEFSGTGGNMGWLSQSQGEIDITCAAFATEIGSFSGPIETPEGFHIIQVLGREVRQLADYEYDQRVDDAFNEWLLSISDEYAIVFEDYWQDRVPTRPNIPAQALPQQQ
ncbi:MAG: SurA N-terminal domain-containing protein [Chloroflexota bacterium]